MARSVRVSGVHRKKGRSVARAADLSRAARVDAIFFNAATSPSPVPSLRPGLSCCTSYYPGAWSPIDRFGIENILSAADETRHRMKMLPIKLPALANGHAWRRDRFPLLCTEHKTVTWSPREMAIPIGPGLFCRFYLGNFILPMELFVNDLENSTIVSLCVSSVFDDLKLEEFHELDHRCKWV